MRDRIPVERMGASRGGSADVVWCRWHSQIGGCIMKKPVMKHWGVLKKAIDLIEEQQKAMERMEERIKYLQEKVEKYEKN